MLFSAEDREEEQFRVVAAKEALLLFGGPNVDIAKKDKFSQKRKKRVGERNVTSSKTDTSNSSFSKNLIREKDIFSYGATMVLVCFIFIR